MDCKINKNLLFEIKKFDRTILGNKKIFLTLSNIQTLYDSYVKNVGFTIDDFTNMLIQQYDVGIYPWKEQINKYYYWQGNFVGASPITQYYFGSVSAPQTSYQAPNNLVPTSAQFNYYGDNLPSGLNTIVLFTGYSKASDVLNNLTNYTTGTNMYSNAMNYFKSNNVQNFLISLCFGGGLDTTGGWNTGMTTCCSKNV
jgi:hypothetical protein